jgi:hypothetical protein
MEIAIFDIDGCISDDYWRLQYIKDEGPGRFDEYHSMCASDSVLQPGAGILQRTISTGRSIAFLTARPESVRSNTTWWLESRFPDLTQHPYILLMRKVDEEGVGSVALKRDMLKQVKGWPTIIAAYDDRPDVVKMYLDAGISGAQILDASGVRNYAGQETKLPYKEGNSTIFSVDTSEPVMSISIASVGGFTSSVEMSAAPKQKTAADILDEAAATFRERNAVYKDNATVVGRVMAALFPNGVKLETPEDHHFYHLFELAIVKLTRFTQSGMKHQDSIHDLAVYAAMLQPLIEKHNIKSN